MPRHRSQQRFFASLILVTAAFGAAAAEPDATRQPVAEPTLSAPVSVADRLLSQTSSAAEAARQWLRENLSNEAFNGYATSAERAVTDRFDRALEAARQEHVATIGLFAFTSPCQSPMGAWGRLVDGVALPPRIVLLVHGLDEGGGVWDDLAPAISQQGYMVLRFNYPNDQRIAASADALVGALRELRRRDVRTVDIVGHSMGGLVTRDALTRPAYYNGDAHGGDGLPAVSRFVMLGTPNLGSPLAGLRQAMEVRDQFVHWLNCENKSASALLGFMVDGHGEAGDDLRPGSAFLTELNARPLPAHVQMTAIIGEIGTSGRKRLCDALDSPYIVRVIGTDRAATLKAETCGVWEDVGDGVVSAASARLGGISDNVAVQANHRSMVRTLEPVEATRDALGFDNPVPPAIPIILDRLSRPAS